MVTFVQYDQAFVHEILSFIRDVLLCSVKCLNDSFGKRCTFAQHGLIWNHARSRCLWESDPQ